MFFCFVDSSAISLLCGCFLFDLIPRMFFAAVVVALAAQPLLEKLRALNIYQINIYQTLLFMYKIKNNLAPNIFKNNFQDISHKYPTRHSAHNFQQLKTISKTTSFSISNRGPFLWNNILEDHDKTILTFSLFKNQIKRRLFSIKNEVIYF